MGPALTLAYAAALAWAAWRHLLPPAALAAVLALNLLAFGAYALDKRAARAGRRRIRERTLHLWALAGGWPAAWWARHLLRHKSAKASFIRMYWLTVALHGAALGAWLAWRLR